ncbi:MAG: hypothetical protein HY822_14440 [Acidobacteria bacterium]|nr:hypothetical protein [Acidobacteriota bacterium]
MSAGLVSECLTEARTLLGRASDILHEPAASGMAGCNRALTDAVAVLRRLEMILQSQPLPDGRGSETSGPLALQAQDLRRSVELLSLQLVSAESLRRDRAGLVALRSGGYGRTGEPERLLPRRSLASET